MLPWKTPRDTICGALQARLAELVNSSAQWPREMHATGTGRLKVVASGGGGTGCAGGAGSGAVASKVLSASAYLEPAQIQDLADLMSRLLEIKAKLQVAI